MASDQKQALDVQGVAAGRIYGIEPAERLRRQIAARGPTMTGQKLVADASCVLSDATLDWMIAHPGFVVRSAGRKSVAVVVEREQTIKIAQIAADSDLSRHSLFEASKDDLSSLFNRKLRRQQDGLVLSLAEQSVVSVEWALFKDVYKGITDVITRYVWPVPAFWLVRLLSRMGVTPNFVTVLGIMLTLLTAAFFYEGSFVAGLAAAWLMTFLDTVDGKLARVTCTSSPLGNQLDHIPDIVHPPVWWACFALGLHHSPEVSHAVAPAATVIVASYLLGRVCEVAFKKQHGFNQYLWNPFDSRLRLVIARRNTILAILTAGVLLGEAEWSFVLAAVWSVLTIGIQPVRCFQANRERLAGRNPIPWLR